MNVKWNGVYPALTTQFKKDQSLDLDGTARHLEAMIKGGIHGVVLLGSVGENTALEYQEKLTVLREMLRVVGGRVPVLTGVAEYTTALACRFAEDAEKLGLDGLMVLPAMVYKSDRRETMAHFRTVARATRPADHDLQQPGLLRRRHHARRCSPNWPTSRRSSPSRNRPTTSAASPTS